MEFRNHLESKLEDKTNEIIHCKANQCRRTFKGNNQACKIKHFIHHISFCSKKRIKCEICDQQFLEKTSLREHLKQHKYENEEKECPKCGQILKGEDNLQNYLNTIKSKVKNGVCLRFNSSDFEALLKIVNDNSAPFQIAYSNINHSNIHLDDEQGKNRDDVLGSLFRKSTLYDLILDYI